MTTSVFLNIVVLKPDETPFNPWMGGSNRVIELFDSHHRRPTSTHAGSFAHSSGLAPLNDDDFAEGPPASAAFAAASPLTASPSTATASASASAADACAGAGAGARGRAAAARKSPRRVTTEMQDRAIHVATVKTRRLHSSEPHPSLSYVSLSVSLSHTANV